MTDDVDDFIQGFRQIFSDAADTLRQVPPAPKLNTNLFYPPDCPPDVKAKMDEVVAWGKANYSKDNFHD